MPNKQIKITLCKDGRHDMYLSFGPLLICRKCIYKRIPKEDDLLKIDKQERIKE